MIPHRSSTTRKNAVTVPIELENILDLFGEPTGAETDIFFVARVWPELIYELFSERNPRITRGEIGSVCLLLVRLSDIATVDTPGNEESSATLRELESKST